MNPLIEMYLVWMALWLLGGAVVVCVFILLGATYRPEPLRLNRNHMIMILVAMGPYCWVVSAAFLVISKLFRLIGPALQFQRWAMLREASKPLSFHRREHLRGKRGPGRKS